MMRKIEPIIEKSDHGEVATKSISEDKSKKIYPQLRFEHKFFPELKKWEVGEEYTITLKLKMVGLSISKFQNDSEFEVLELEIETKDNKK